MRIVFIGSQNLGHNCLKHLIQSENEVVTVFTFEPESHEVWKAKVKDLATSKSIPTYLTKKIGEKEIEVIKKLKTDVIFVIGWRTIIPKEVYTAPKLGCIAMHASLLPKNRGFAPLNWALIKDEKETGITMFYIGGGTDTGDIIGQKKVGIAENDDIDTLKKKIDVVGSELFIEMLPLIKSGKNLRIRQIEGKTTYNCMRIPEDSFIDWKKPNRDLYNLIRATTKPYTGAYFFYEGKKVTVWDSELIKDDISYFGTPGQITDIIKDKGVIVMTGSGRILIKNIQIDGNELSADKQFGSLKTRLVQPG